MGQKSSIDCLPEDLRHKLLTLLKDPSVTQAQIVEELNTKAGGIVVSKSSVNRYKLRMDKFIEKSRQAREVADSYVEKFADSRRNSIGKVLNEQIRLYAFDFMQDLQVLQDNGELEPEKIADMLSKLAKSTRELEQADKINAEREDTIRKTVLEETAAKLEDAQSKNQSVKDVINQLRLELTGGTK